MKVWKYIFVYKTTNIINNKYYIGVHCTNNIDDGYLGSGLHLCKAIEKYGRHKFTREILYYFNTVDEAFDKERKIITNKIINDPLSYNLALGGNGGNLGEESNKKKRGKLNGMNKIPKEETPCYGRTGKKHPLYGKPFKEFTTTEGRKKHAEKIRESKLGGKNPAAKKVKCTKTNKVFNTINEAANYLSMRPGTLSKWLQGVLTNRSTMVYVR